MFIGVMATFLRAIKAGVIHFRHAVTLLTHYGRLGPVFDHCAKIVVEILREEGMYKSNGETVVAVVLQALREVCVSRHDILNDSYVLYSHSCFILTALLEPKSILWLLESSSHRAS